MRLLNGVTTIVPIELRRAIAPRSTVQILECRTNRARTAPCSRTVAPYPPPTRPARLPCTRVAMAALRTFRIVLGIDFASLLWVDAVEKLELFSLLGDFFEAKTASSLSAGLGFGSCLRKFHRHVTHAGADWDGGPSGRSAMVLRFCTMAARWNSSRAPERPLSRIRSKP
jgi:hypothetical protein